MSTSAARRLRGLLLCLAVAKSIQSLGYDVSENNGVCGTGMWSAMAHGDACPALVGDRVFRFFRQTSACLMWHSGTKNWHGAYDHCEQVGIDISKPVKLALPANALQRLHWSWRDNNYWAGARRQVGSSKYWVSYKAYGSNTNDVEEPGDNDDGAQGVWDTDEPSGSHQDNLLSPVVQENCLQIRANQRWNDESCTDQNSFYCYLPTECRACGTGSCPAWHTRRTCTITSDSNCVECTWVNACAVGTTPAPNGGCTCVNCVAGTTYKSSAGSAGCTSCSTGPCGNWQTRSACTISSDSTCQACAGQCGIGKTPAEGCTCSDCLPGTYKADVGNGPCVQCDEYMYQDAHGASSCKPVMMQCVSCPDGQYLSQPTNACTECPTHSRVPDTANATSVLQCECAAGYEPVLGQCTMCSVGSYKIGLGNGSCALCATSATTSEPGATAAEACMCSPGFQLSAGACVQCPAGTSKNLISNDNCGLCQPGVYCPLGSVTPTTCIAHSERTVPGGQALSDCLCVAGYYATPTTDGVFSCEACAPGSFKDVASNAQCTLCAANTYNPDTTAVSVDSCRPCNPNATSPTGSTTDTQCLCAAGYSGVPGSQCVACEVGKFRGDMTQYICSDCPADSYNAQLHMVSAQSCLPCPANTSTGSANGSGSIFDCVCNPGFSAGLDFSWRCSECGMGRFQSTPNSSSCDACPNGTYSNATGAVSITICQTCANGSYAESVANIECKACLPGTWQDLRAGDAKTRPCTACPSNSNSSVTGSTEVEQCVCKVGYAISTAHVQGSPDTYSCQECLAGYFCPGGGVFTNCPMNHWSFAGINPGPCRQCAPYSYAARLTAMTGPTLCYCSRGTGGNFDSTCTPCATGTYQPCDFSINMNNTGYNCSESYTAPTCISCPVNTYSDSQQVSTCDACPQNASSAEGSKRAQDCVCDNSYYGENGEQCLPCEPGYFCSGNSKTLCRVNSNSSALAWTEAGCACDAGFFSNTTAGYCYACTPGFYCPGGNVKIICPTNSSSIRQSSLVASCLCDPGTRRDCVGGASEAGICIVDVYSACHQCAQGDICFESTLVHCPDNSTSPRGSDHGDDCACNAGFFNTVVDDEHAHRI